MTVTVTHFFVLSVLAILGSVYLELRKQKILKTLAANLVTVHIKNEDSTTQLVGLYARTAGVQEALLEILRGSKEDRESVSDLADLLSGTRKRLQDVEDKFQQNKAINDAIIEDGIADGLSDLRKELERIVEDKFRANPAGGSILEQIQKLDVSQIYDLATKSGVALDKVRPILEVLGSLRNGIPSKN